MLDFLTHKSEADESEDDVFLPKAVETIKVPTARRLSEQQSRELESEIFKAFGIDKKTLHHEFLSL